MSLTASIVCISTYFIWTAAQQRAQFNAVLQEGIESLKKHQSQQALDKFDKAARLRPDSARAVYYRALAEARLRDLDAAERHLEQARKLGMSTKAVEMALVAVKGGKGDFEAAASHCYDLIDLDGKNPSTAAPIFLIRGLSQMHAGRYELAVEDLSQAAISDDPKIRVQALRERGCAYLKLKKPKHALSDFTQALTLDPHDAGALSQVDLIKKTAPSHEE